MTTRVSVTARNAALTSMTAQLDAGSSAGYIQIRTGSQPGSIATAATGTLLGTLDLSDPAFNTPVNGAATARTIASDTADASGVAGWFRAYNSSGQAVIDGSITAVSGGGDMTMNDTQVMTGSPISISVWTLSLPESG
jgi:hypothetical protein